MPTGSSLHLVSRSRPPLEYHLYLPERQTETGRVLVSVHGVSRNAAEHVELFRELAERHSVTLIAPVFNTRTFRDYQRLGRQGVGPRADLALIRLLNEIAMHTGIDTGKVDLFGFSGGAQFAHRFTFVHTQRVRRLALGAAGWYTMPNRSLSYPHGAADALGLQGARLNPAAAARLRTLVMVGDLDNREDDEDLNRAKVIMRTQGRHRIERARAWTNAMNRIALQGGSSAAVDMMMLPGVAHSFRQAVTQGGLGDRLFEHCYGLPPMNPSIASVDAPADNWHRHVEYRQPI